MNKKRVLSILSAAVLAAGMLAGCGSSSFSSSSSSTAAATDAAATTEAAAATTEAAATDTAASGTVENKDKPVCWFNRQPSNSSTGELDMTALNFNKDTYYVGFDANQGAELQGQMVEQYIEDHADTIDRNGDGVIGYVLAIGDIGHNDSIARTRGVRKALQTAVENGGDIDANPIGTNTDGSATDVQDGTLTVGGKTYTIRELAS